MGPACTIYYLPFDGADELGLPHCNAVGLTAGRCSKTGVGGNLSLHGGLEGG